MINDFVLNCNRMYISFLILLEVNESIVDESLCLCKRVKNVEIAGLESAFIMIIIV